MTLRSWRFAVAVALPLVALGVLAAQQTLTQRFPQFENDDVKVWKSVIAPNAPLAPHRHEHGRVLIPLRGGPIDIVQADGSTEHFVWETGKPFWLPASPPNTMHSDLNKGPGTIEVVVVELKKDK
jgi:hypothetical protein